MNGIFSRWIRQRIGDTAGGPLARHPISFSTTPRQNLNRSFVENFPDTTTIRRAVVVVFLIYSIRINLGILKPRWENNHYQTQGLVDTHPSIVPLPGARYYNPKNREERCKQRLVAVSFLSATRTIFKSYPTKNFSAIKIWHNIYPRWFLMSKHQRSLFAAQQTGECITERRHSP